MFSHMPIEKRLLGHKVWVEYRHWCTDLVRFTFRLAILKARQG